MNIKITHSWLLEYLDTDATPYQIQKYLSLSGPSVEQVQKINGDYVYEIEITSNRIDTASVFGIAQECQAILPMFGKKAKLKNNPLKQFKLRKINCQNRQKNHLNIKIKEKNLCSRFTAVVLDNVEIKPSPGFIKQRLNACGIKTINNVVDISNYLMVDLGQPSHIFDYDAIGKDKTKLIPTMMMRSARKGEKIITLDGKEIILPGGDIVIEDGEGRLIDLCGLMGSLNSSVTNKTKRIVFFVQTYNKQKIRQTLMTTGQKTVAASYFEKGLDEERVEPTLVYGLSLLEKYAGAKVSSKIYDLYPNPYQKKSVVVDYSLFKKIIGIEISKNLVVNILKNLGLEVDKPDKQEEKIKVTIPSYRKDDVKIKEDVVEEVARIYGYYNLPTNLPPLVYLKQPKEFDDLFNIQKRIKLFLKHLGLNEVINYSMISKKDIEEYQLNPRDHLRISNPISKEIEYLRISLLPSLVENLKENTGKKEGLKFFEIGKVYKRKKNNLPEEIYRLAIGVNTSFFDLKGIIEALYQELNIEEDVSDKIITKDNLFLVEIDLKRLIKISKDIPRYKPINPYAVVKLDLTVKRSKKLTFATIKGLAFKTSKLLQKIDLVDFFQNKLTLRFYFASHQRNITEEEAKKELENIKARLGSE